MDEGLLTSESKLWHGDFLVGICEEFFKESNGAVDDTIWAAMDKVRVETYELTASIKEAECQKRVEKFEKQALVFEKGYWRVKVMASELTKYWQALKEGVK